MKKIQKKRDLREKNYPFSVAAWIIVVILFFLGASYVRERQKPVTLYIPKFETQNHSQ